MTYRRRRAAGNGGRHSSRRSRSSHRSRSGGGRRQGGTPGRSPARSRRSRSDATAEVEVRGSHQVGCWPHGQSFLFASLGVVIGMFSISRFVVLTIDFGGEFSPSLPPSVELGGALGLSRKQTIENRETKNEQIIRTGPHTSTNSRADTAGSKKFEGCLGDHKVM